MAAIRGRHFVSAAAAAAGPPVRSGPAPNCEYEKIRLIGKGTYGRVYLARNRHQPLNSQQFVMKEVAVDTHRDFSKLLSEVQVLMRCGDGHPNVCRYVMPFSFFFFF
jgi:serine/threonine protein kinase